MQPAFSEPRVTSWALREDTKWGGIRFLLLIEPPPLYVYSKRIHKNNDTVSYGMFIFANIVIEIKQTFNNRPEKHLFRHFPTFYGI